MIDAAAVAPVGGARGPVLVAKLRLAQMIERRIGLLLQRDEIDLRRPPYAGVGYTGHPPARSIRQHRQ